MMWEGANGWETPGDVSIAQGINRKGVLPSPRQKALAYHSEVDVRALRDTIACSLSLDMDTSFP